MKERPIQRTDYIGNVPLYQKKDKQNTFISYFRYPTKEEADTVNRYINSISSQTGVNFWDM